MEATSNINERRPYYKEAGKALREISVNLVFAFIFTALFFKHSGYSNEGEYRFLIMTLPNERLPGLKMLAKRKGRKVGCFEFDSKTRYPDALSQVKIGPAQKEARGRRVIAKALKRAGLTADVGMSTMPVVKV